MPEQHLLFCYTRKNEEIRMSQTVVHCERVLLIRKQDLSLCGAKFNLTGQIFTEVAQERQGVELISVKEGGKKVEIFLIPALVSSVSQLVSLLSGWLISSHRCLLSRRRSSLTSLRGSWLQERGSWLQMSPQVEPPILPQVARGGRRALRQGHLW